VTAPFAQLVVRTPWSLGRGASTVEELAAAAARRGISAVGIADRGSLAGVVPAWDALTAAGVRPIVGAELRGTDGSAVVMARDARGWSHLSAAASALALEPGRSLARQLEDRSAGLFVLCGDRRLLSALTRVVPRRRLRVAVSSMDALRSLAPVGHQLGLRPVAVGDVHFASPSGRARHRALRAIALRVPPERVPAAALAGADAWLAGPDEVRRRFADCPEAVAEAAAVADACRLDLPRDLAFGRLRFPRAADGPRELAMRCRAGLRRRVGALDEAHRARAERELAVIVGLGYAPYFLVLADLVAFARERKIPHWGRGSAAGSLVAFALGLSPVDPLDHGLLFERFLNPARRDPPDVDLDLDWRRRDEVIDHLAARHGAGRVARQGSAVTYGARGAVRELGTVVGVPDRQLGRLTRALPASKRPLAPAALERAIRLAGPTLAGDRLGRLLGTASAIQGFPRHLALHASGVLVSPLPLAPWIPLFRAARGQVATQWSMGPVARAGLVKIDLLGNRALAALADARAAVVAAGGPDPGAADAAGDPATRSLIRRGETLGCFHVESPAIRGLVRRMGCRDRTDLITASSLVRPGVAASGMMARFLERRQGGGPPPSPAALAQVLAATHGVMVHQEDVMRVAREVAGLDLAHADELRRALTRREHRHRLPGLRRAFDDGARRRGLTGPEVREVWRQIESFAGYAFCKAHSASFAALSDRAAYLRAHHPAELMAAVLSQRGGYYGPAAYVSESRRMGLALSGPCVNRSLVRFTAEAGGVRVGLMQVRGLRPAAQAAIVEDRGRRGPYLGPADLRARVDLRSREVDALGRCGALDACGGGGGDREGPGRLLDELEVLGFGVCGHPLDLFLPLQRGPRDRAVDLARCVGRRVRLAAWRVASKPLRTRGGRPMELLSFEDETGLFEAAVFPEAHARAAGALLEPGPFWIRGRVCEDRGAPSVVVDHIGVMEVPDGRAATRSDPGSGGGGRPGDGAGRLPQRLAGG